MVPEPPTIVVASLPSCSDVEEVCIIFEGFGTDASEEPGPTRRPHAVPQADLCTSFLSSCIILVTPIRGPARGVHATPSAHAPGHAAPAGNGNSYHPGDTFQIPSVCFELPTGGADVMPVLLVGGLFVLAGVGLLGAHHRRRGAVV